MLKKGIRNLEFRSTWLTVFPVSRYGSSVTSSPIDCTSSHRQSINSCNMGKKLIDSKTSETHMTATRQMAFGFAGGYERAFTQREQRFYLLVDARGNRSVRYVNFEKHFTDEHGYWEFNPVSQALFIKFNHWGSSGTARRCLLNRSHTMELDLDNSCFPHVCFEGRDYLDRSICIRLGSWTSDPSKGIIKDGTVDMEYWKREPVNILNIMSRYGRQCDLGAALSIRDTIDTLDLNYRLRPSTQYLDSELPTRDPIDTLDLAVKYPTPKSKL